VIAREAGYVSVRTIDVIGCGNVGKALLRVWTRHNVFEVRSILNRSLESGCEAADFLGSGRPIESYAQLERADVIMISASDESIESCCRQLCSGGVLDHRTVLFHCSGSLPSTLLEPARRQGASIASLHPVKSFADPALAADTFGGTFCAVEGDPPACQVISEALHRCGAKTFHVEAEFKTVYHAATVVVCNYLVALLEVGFRCFERAGLSRAAAAEIIRPIVSGTVDNVFELGPVRALTGPIARGEKSVVARQTEALGCSEEAVQQVYKSLGLVAAQLSAAQGNADPDALAAIAEILQS